TNVLAVELHQSGSSSSDISFDLGLTGTGQGSAPSQAVTVTATDASAAEAGTDSGTFTISRTGSTAAALTVFYSLAGTASNSLDYQSLPGSVTIPAGATSATVTIVPVDDAL